MPHPSLPRRRLLAWLSATAALPVAAACSGKPAQAKSFPVSYSEAEWRRRLTPAQFTILRQKGTNRSQFLRGQVDKYTWVDVGSSYVPSDMLAAFLLGQLEHLETITGKRREIYQRYEALLTPLVERGLLVELVDITDPEDLTDAYGLRIPVLRRVDTGAELDWPFDTEQVVAFLR